MFTYILPDALAVVCLVEKSTDRERIQHNLVAICNEVASFAMVPCEKVIYSKGRYRNSSKLPIYDDISTFSLRKSDPYLLVQWRPKVAGLAFLRIEFNGMPLMLERTELVANLIEKIFNGVLSSQDIPEHLLVTKLHIAAGIELNPNDIWLDRARSQVTIYVHNRRGKLKTLYIGENRSGTQICLYDKRSQLRNSKIPQGRISRTRLEWKFNFKHRSGQASIAEILHHLNFLEEIGNLVFYNSAAIKHSGILSDELSSLLDYIPLKIILQSTTKARRNRLKKHLETFRMHKLSRSELMVELESLRILLVSLVSAIPAINSPKGQH